MREDPNKQNKKWKRKNYNPCHKEHKKIIRDYCEQFYANKLDNLEESDKFWEIYILPRLNQEEIENMNKPITSNEFETVIKNLPTNKSPYTILSTFCVFEIFSKGKQHSIDNHTGDKKIFSVFLFSLNHSL